MGSHQLKPLHVQTLSSRQTRHKSVEIYRRPKVFEELLRHKAAPDGVTTRSSTPNVKGRLHFLLRPEGRLLRYGNRSIAARLPNCQHAR
jgi:hypothetical protein